MRAAEQVPLPTTVTSFPLAETAGALEALREGSFTGAAMLVP